VIVIGLTGGIASGKSTVSRMLKSLGAKIIDADQLARDLVRPGRPAWRDIVHHFGRGILLENGEINRKELGRVVFSDPEARRLLNRLTHPRVKSRTKAILRKLARVDPQAVVVIDAPLLLEAGMDDLVDEIWVVSASPDTQIRRLMARDQLTREEAVQRLEAQMPLAEKIKRAHRVIDNEGAEEDTWRQVLACWQAVQEKRGDEAEKGQ
jgi:dephospho-CoA kinase